MMTGILADNNVIGQVRILAELLESADWQELWASLNLSVRSFDEFGLEHDSADDVIWHMCQKEELVLITNNRNADGPDSLEETIRQHNTPESLPVFTFADFEKFSRSQEYAQRVVERLLEYLIDIDKFRGTGRLYLP